MNHRWTRLLALVALGLLAATPVAAPPPDAAALARAAKLATEQGDWARVLSLYDDLRAVLPQSPEIPYNMGVAAYRQGDLERAAALFDEAANLAADPRLRSSAAYNLGTTSYAQGLGGPGGGPGAAAATQQLDDATKQLEEVLRHFRRALDDDPDDLDARANAELAQRRLQRLREMQQQMQQQQQQQQQGEQSQDQQPQQQQDQQGQPQQPEGQDPQQQQRPSSSGDTTPSDEQQTTPPQPSPDEPSTGEDEPPPPAPAPGEDEPQPATPEASDETQATPAGAEPRRMTREEAERLLQMVRDKERRRAEEQARRRPAGRAPVDKDW